MSNIYDVIICGAGPAGSIAATILGRKGHNVLLIDSKDFPRDKTCGDQLPPEGVRLLRELNVIDNHFLSKTNPINKAKVFGPYSSNVNLQFNFKLNRPEIYIIPRIILDNHIVKCAEKTGITSYTGKVISIKNRTDCISLKTKSGKKIREFKSRIMIGADGSSSTIARLSNLKPWRQRAMAIRGYLSGIKVNPNTFEGYYNPIWWPGYAWIFPLSNETANIGLGMNLKNYRKCDMTFQKMLQVYIEKLNNNKRLNVDHKLENVKTWPLNIGPPIWNQLITKRIILVGDAAALVSPFTGGGIVNAILSAKIAAEVISKKIQSNDLSEKPLLEYIVNLKKETYREFKMSQLLSRFLSLSPNIVEKLIKITRKANWPINFMNSIYKDVQISRID